MGPLVYRGKNISSLHEGKLDYTVKFGGVGFDVCVILVTVTVKGF